MQRDELRNIMEEYRKSGSPFHNINSLIDFLLKKDCFTYESIIEIIFYTKQFDCFTPKIISSFLANFSKAVGAKTILDPFAKYGQVAMETAKCSDGNIHAICINHDGDDILQLYKPDNKS